MNETNFIFVFTRQIEDKTVIVVTVGKSIENVVGKKPMTLCDGYWHVGTYTMDGGYIGEEHICTKSGKVVVSPRLVRFM